MKTLPHPQPPVTGPNSSVFAEKHPHRPRPLQWGCPPPREILDPPRTSCNVLHNMSRKPL